MARKYNNSPFYIKLEGKFPPYICTICGRPFWHAKDAWRCCFDKKPASPYLVECALTALNHAPALHLATPRTHSPGDGITHPDKWGHWYRGNNPDKKRTADYHYAIFMLQKQLTREDCLRLNKLYPIWDLTDEEYRRRLENPSRTPLQKFNFAWLTGNRYAALYAVRDMVDTATARPDSEHPLPWLEFKRIKPDSNPDDKPDLVLDASTLCKPDYVKKLKEKLCKMK